MTSQITDRFIKIQDLRDRIRNELYEVGLCVQRSVLSRGNRAHRLQWTQEHANWIRRHWGRILFMIWICTRYKNKNVDTIWQRSTICHSIGGPYTA